jgi:hypothetical protein
MILRIGSQNDVIGPASGPLIASDPIVAFAHDTQSDCNFPASNSGRTKKRVRDGDAAEFSNRFL